MKRSQAQTDSANLVLLPASALTPWWPHPLYLALVFSATWILKWASQSLFFQWPCFPGRAQVPKQTLYSSDTLATYKWYSGALCKLPRLYFIAFKCSFLLPGSKRIDTVIVFFCGLLSSRSIQLREEISLERVVYLCWSHHRSKLLKEHLQPHGAAQGKKLLSSGDSSVFSSLTQIPPWPRLELGTGEGTNSKSYFHCSFADFLSKTSWGPFTPLHLWK